MSVGFDIVVTGQADIDRKMRALDRKVKRKLTRTAVKAGANIIKNQAASNAITMVGGEMGDLLAKNLKVHVFRKQRRGSYGVSVWVKPGVMGFMWLTQDGTQEYIPAAIEFGNYGGWQQENPTFVPAIPFVRTAFDSKRAAAERAIARMLGLGIETGVAMTMLNE